MRFAWLLLFAAPHASAAWIGVCPEAGGHKVLEEIVDAKGTPSVLVAAAENVPGCTMREVAIEPGAVTWARTITTALAGTLRQGVMLDGEEMLPLRDGAPKPPPRFTSQPPQPAARPAPKRSMWAWKPAAWIENPQALFELLAANGADTVFITVLLDPGGTHVLEPGRLARFIESASARGVKVLAVAGDPRAVLPAERPKYAARARALADFNKGAPPEAKLAGFQLDIEPYLNRGYDMDTESWLAAYVDTIAEAKTAVQMPLDVVLPFWWGQQKLKGRLLLDHLAPHVDAVTVMDYRTDRNLILEFAEPFLAWSARSRRSVRIALEAGPLPQAPVLAYRPAPRGEIWIVPVENRALAVRFDKPVAGLPGAAFAYSHANPPTAGRITFHGDLSALREMLPGLEDVWRAWPHFGGVALHGLD